MKTERQTNRFLKVSSKTDRQNCKRESLFFCTRHSTFQESTAPTKAKANALFNFKRKIRFFFLKKKYLVNRYN
jgi:hypothetical protein